MTQFYKNVIGFPLLLIAYILISASSALAQDATWQHDLGCTTGTYMATDVLYRLEGQHCWWLDGLAVESGCVVYEFTANSNNAPLIWSDLGLEALGIGLDGIFENFGIKPQRNGLAVSAGF